MATTTRMALTKTTEPHQADVGEDLGAGSSLCRLTAFSDEAWPMQHGSGGRAPVYVGGGVADLPSHAPRWRVWQAIALYAFVAAPLGNGLDTYRTWGTLVLARIVLIKVRGSYCELLSGCRTERNPFSYAVRFFGTVKIRAMK